MPAPSATDRQRQAHYAPVRRVLWAVLAANLAITAVKITLGLMTGALAVVADGFHSLVDSSSNLIGLAAIRLAERPADRGHPYGYSRYETIGTLVIGGMLIVAGYEVSRAIIERLLSGESPALTPLTFWLVILTWPVNLVIYLLENRAGRRLESQVLLADAAHTRTDLFVTLSVIASLIAVQLGWPWFDLLIASFVVVMIVRAALGILRSAASSLTDRIVVDPEQVEELVLAVPGVRAVHHIRSRGAPGYGFVDMHVKVHAGMSTDQAHAIASEVERRLQASLPGVADALVHIEPASQSPTLMERIRYDLRQIADGMGLGFHDLHVHAEDDGSYTVEVHLEMHPDISIREAHALADEFEARVAAQASRPFKLIAHLEPVPDQVLYTDPVNAPELRAELERLVADRSPGSRLVDFQTYRLGQRLGAAAVITVSPDDSLSGSHALSEYIERAMLNSFPDLHRLTVHVEPEDRA